MAKVKVENLEPGMIAGADVKNLDGMLLMPAGGELSERHIRILNTWGIAEVAVRTDDQAEDEAAARRPVPAEASPARVRELKARFYQFEETNAVQQEILRLLLRRQTK